MRFSTRSILVVVVFFSVLLATLFNWSPSLRNSGKNLEFLVVDFPGHERVTLRGDSAKSYFGYLLDSTSKELISLNQIPYLKATLLDDQKHAYGTLYITSQVGVDYETSFQPFLDKLGRYKPTTDLEDFPTSQIQHRRRVSGTNRQ